MSEFDQLALNLNLKDDCTLESFYCSEHNQQLLDYLKKIARLKGEQTTLIWGNVGVGLTHLLLGTVAKAVDNKLSAIYLSCSDKSFSAARLEGIEKCDLICWDNIEYLKGNLELQEHFFASFNEIRTLNKRLLVASHLPPKALNLELKDLQSRLLWGVTYKVSGLNDQDLQQALILRASARGIEITQDVAQFIVNRTVRTMSDLYQILEKLDLYSLKAKRKITIPFIKSILAI